MFAENLAPFFADWGETVTLAGSAVTAIFNDGFNAALNIAGTAPSVLCRSADIIALTVGAAAVVRGVNYVVRGLEPAAPDKALTDVLLERT